MANLAGGMAEDKAGSPGDESGSPAEEGGSPAAEEGSPFSENLSPGSGNPSWQEEIVIESDDGLLSLSPDSSHLPRPSILRESAKLRQIYLPRLDLPLHGDSISIIIPTALTGTQCSCI
jgi:hypothetical protein